MSFICRRCKDKDNKNIQWPDVSANDYLHRPETIHNMCFVEQITKYSKAYKQVKLQDKKNNTVRKNNNTNTELLVGKDHPGYGFAYLKENRIFKIPLVSIPDGFLCQLRDLHLGSKDVTPEVSNNQERYAKTALIMFYPFCCLGDLQTGKSYRKTFDACCTRHFTRSGKVSGTSGHSVSFTVTGHICFWEKDSKFCRTWRKS